MFNFSRKEKGPKIDIDLNPEEDGKEDDVDIELKPPKEDDIELKPPKEDDIELKPKEKENDFDIDLNPEKKDK